MNVSAKQYARALIESLQETSIRRQRRTIGNMVKTLKKNNDINLADSIIAEFSEQIDYQKNDRKIEITTVSPITNIRSMSKTIQEKTGQKYIVDNKIDENLIAGTIIRIADYKFDLTVKSRLNKVKKKEKSKIEKLPEEIVIILKIITTNLN